MVAVANDRFVYAPLPFERRLGDLLCPLRPEKAQAVACAFWDIAIVLAVARRENDRREPGTGGGDDLFLDAADWQHEAAQADFAGHRRVTAHGPVGQ